MRRRLRIALMALLTLVLVVSVAKTIYQLIQYRWGDEDYSAAKSLVDLPDLSSLPEVIDPDAASQGEEGENGEADSVYVDPYADALRNMDFTALREVNSDVLGWILIPGTNLSYPLVQGDDNSYYLNHTWRKGRNSVGAIFLECTNSSSLRDFNTIIYGHRMNNRSMFGILHYYKDSSYWRSHPYVYITDDSGSHRYEIFAAYEVSTSGDTYRLGFSDDQAKQSFIDYCLAQSVIDTGITPNVYDRILTLSTCTGNGHATRWVVQAVLKGVAPADTAQQPSEEPAVEEPPAVPDASEPSGEQPAREPDVSVPEGPAAEGPVSQDIRPGRDEGADAPLPGDASEPADASVSAETASDSPEVQPEKPEEPEVQPEEPEAETPGR